MSNDIQYTNPKTPAAKWRAEGEPDPFGLQYEIERAALTLGHLTDDELANAVFYYGNDRPNYEQLIDPEYTPPIAYLTAAKERIRWLSRALVRELEKNERLTKKE